MEYKVHKFLEKKGFILIRSAQGIFKRSDNDMILSIYVNDDLLIGSDTRLIDMFLKQ